MRSFIPSAATRSAKKVMAVPNASSLHLWTPQRSFHVTAGHLGKIVSFNLADIGEGITECEVIQWCAIRFIRFNPFTLW